MTSLISIFSIWGKILTFRATREDYQRLGPVHFAAGLFVTWIVGMGRYWDDPRATLPQKLGVGSVAYIFILALVLWIIVKPLAPRRFTYGGILTFITCTSPPAILYAIPIEMWVPLETANMTNLVFLLVVALWRVCLYFHYLMRFGELASPIVSLAGIMPLALIFNTLLILNLHHVVFNIMGGIREADKTSQDAAYSILFTLSILTTPVSLACAISWIGILLKKSLDHLKARRALRPADSPPGS